MGYRVLIRDEQTKEERWYEWDHSDWESGDYWQWTDGNFGCDCNRGLMFYSSEDADAEYNDADINEAGHLEFPCLSDRFTIDYILLPDGTTILIDTSEEGRHGPQAREGS